MLAFIALTFIVREYLKQIEEDKTVKEMEDLDDFWHNEQAI